MPLTDAQRRTRGQWRLVCWLPAEYERRLERLAKLFGSRAMALMDLIDDALAAEEQHKKRKGRK